MPQQQKPTATAPPPSAKTRPNYARVRAEIEDEAAAAESINGVALAVRNGAERLAAFVRLGAVERADIQDDLLAIADRHELVKAFGKSAVMDQIHAGLDAGCRLPSAPAPAADQAPASIDKPAAPPPLAATPYQWREPEQITRRAWLYGRHYIRRFVSATIGRPGQGKTNLAITEMLDMVSAGAILDHHPREPLRVWYVGEDPADEIERRIAAACALHRLRPDDVAGRLFVNSTLDLPALRIAHMGPRAPVVNDATVDALAGEMAARKIDVLILDPLIKFHSVEEGNPSQMESVVRALGELAGRANAAVEVLHHTRKQAPGVAAATTVDDGRGASSIVAAARSARVLNPMTVAEAPLAGIAEGDRWRYARLDSGKANMAPPAATRWIQHVSELLPCGESVGVVAAWKYPDAFAAFSASDLPRVRELARTGTYRSDPQSTEWFGVAVAGMLEMDIRDKTTRARVNQMIKTWLKTKALDIEIREDNQRHKRKYIVPGPFEVLQ